MSTAYVKTYVPESPLQNVPSTPRLTTTSYQLDASPLAVVPELVNQRATPAPSPFINFSRCEYVYGHDRFQLVAAAVRIK